MCCRVLLSVLLCLIFIPFGVIFAANDAGVEKKIDDIVMLSHRGKDREVIEIYESLPSDAVLSLVAMRAVAGCYWREKQFDSSRKLYRKILDNRPALSRLSDKYESAETASEAKISKAEAKRNAEIADELKKMRGANEALKKEREKLRRKTEERIAEVMSSAELSSRAAEKLRLELSDARKERKAADSAAAQIQDSINDQKGRLVKKVALLEESLKKAELEVSGLEKARKAEIEKLEKDLVDEKKTREKLSKTFSKKIAAVKSAEFKSSRAAENLSRELAAAQAKLKSSESLSAEMRTEIVSLEDELRLAEMEVDQGRIDAAKSIEESKKRTSALLEKISVLKEKSKSMNCEIVSLSKALDDARSKNAELSAMRENEELETSARMDEIEKTALSLALDEIDALEREYMELDSQAGERQGELLARIDELEQSAVTGELDLKDVRRQLELERLKRKEIEAESEKRDGMLLDANRILAESTKKITKQFAEFRAQSCVGKLRDNTRRQADLAPLISKLEEATKTASLEVKSLQGVLAEERRKHEESVIASRQEIVLLRRKIERLSQEITVLKSADQDAEARWAAETERKLAEVRKAGEVREAELKAVADKQLSELNAAYDIRIDKLKEEVAGLGDKIKVSAEALSQAKEALALEKGRYAELVKSASESEAKLKKRIHDFEFAPVSPEATDTAVESPADVKQSKPESDTNIDELYQSIIDTSRTDKSLSLLQYESLPADYIRPATLIKTIANVYRDKKEYDKAYKMYEEVLARNPGDSYAERKLVMTLFDLGRYDEALAYLSGKAKNKIPMGNSAGFEK